MKKLISYILSVTLFVPLFPQPAYAGGKEVEIAFQWLRNGGVMAIGKAEGDEVLRIAAQSASKTAIKETRPSEVSKLFKGMGNFTGKIALEKLKRFPVESFGFFLSLGAVMTLNMIFNYSNNPVGFKQLGDSQMDMVGQFGFYAFMVANGMVAEPLQNMYINGKLNPRLGPFIPFMGMSVGMIASNIVHEIGHNKNLMKCAGDLMSAKGLNKEACDKAHEEWVERGEFAGMANEFAPSLLGLIGATVMSGMTKQAPQFAGKVAAFGARQAGKVVVKMGLAEAMAISKAAGAWATKKLIQCLGIELIIALVPGGIELKAARGFIAFVGEMFLFNWWIEVIQPPVNEAWNNFTKSTRDGSHMDFIRDHMNREENKKWELSKGDSIMSVSELLPHVTKHMAEWRQANMEPALITQSNWEQATSNLALEYRASKLFYSNFLGNLWEKKYGKNAGLYASGQETRITDRVFPLYGVRPTGLPELTADMPNYYMTSPWVVEEAQIFTLKQTAEKYLSGKVDLKNMGKEERARFENKLKIFTATSSPMTAGYAIEQMRCVIGVGSLVIQKFPCAEGRNWGNNHLADNFDKFLNEVAVKVGEKDIIYPSPRWYPGFGYADIYAKDPSNIEAMQTMSTRIGGLATPEERRTLVVEEMLSGMLNGPNPEKPATLVTEKWGFPASLKFPSVAEEFDWYNPSKGYYFPCMMFMGHAAMCDEPKVTSRRFKQTTDAYGFLTRPENLRSSVMNMNRSSIDSWWTTYVERHYVAAWVKFEAAYQQNITKLVKLFWAGKNPLNWGPVENGLVPSMVQETYLYMVILNRLSHMQMWAEHGSKMHPYLVTRSGYNLTGSWSRSPLAKMWDSGLFQWEADYLTYVKQLENMFGKIKSRKLETMGGVSGEFPVSTLSSADLKQLTDAMEERIQTIEKVMGVNEPTQGEAAMSNLLQQGQEFLLQGALAGANVINVLANPVAGFRRSPVQDQGQYVLAADEYEQEEAETGSGESPLAEGAPAAPFEGAKRLMHLNFEQRKLAKAAIAGLRSVLQDSGNILNVVNAVSYIERHDNTFNGIFNPRCANMHASAGVGGIKMSQDQLKVAGCAK